jgi:hypothetical protein
MKKYIGYRLKSSFNKWIIIMVVIICFSILAAKYFDPNILTYNDWILIMFDNRVLLSTLFTLLPFLIFFDIGYLKRWNIQSIIRFGNISKWYFSELTYLFLACFLFIAILALVFLIVGFSSGYSIVDTWEKTFFYSNTLINANSFDQSGNPMYFLMVNKISPLISIFYAYCLYFCRIIFYALLLMLFNLKLNRPALGIGVALIFNWIEVYFYALKTFFIPLYILPFEHSIVTSINGYRSQIYFSFVYWVLLLGLEVLLGKSSSNNAMSSLMKQKKV